MTEFPDDDTGEALRQFKNQGFDLSKNMEIDFFVAVPSKEIGDKVSVEASRLGYITSVEQDEETKQWTCYCTITVVPKYDAIVEIEAELEHVAKKYYCYIDGFGSYGNIK